MIREVINELKKYTLGKKNTEKVEISVLQLNRVIKALEQESILDKIRAEIEKKRARAKQMSSVLQMNAYTDCLQIIDKYKAEGSDKE